MESLSTNRAILTRVRFFVENLLHSLRADRLSYAHGQRSVGDAQHGDPNGLDTPDLVVPKPELRSFAEPSVPDTGSAQRVDE